MATSELYPLNCDLALIVAEHAELATLSALMRTNKATNELIRSHERSIARARIANLSHDQSKFLPPCKRIMSSATPERKAIPLISLEAVGELELRAKRRAQFLAPHSLMARAIQDSYAFCCLPRVEMARLMEILSRACILVDYFGDLVAEAMTRCSCKEGKLAQQRTVRLARRLQLNTIRNLPPADLASVMTLITFASNAYASESQQREMMEDLWAWDRITAFQETILRSGASLTIWALLSDSPPSSGNDGSTKTRPTGKSGLARLVEQTIEMVQMEMVEWEKGNGIDPDDLDDDEQELGVSNDGQKDSESSIFEAQDWDDRILPGLNMTIFRSFAKKINQDVRRASVECDLLLLRAVRE